MRALGARLDISHSTVADWEHARSYPSSYEVQRLAEELGTTICGLYGVEEGHQVPAALTLAEQLAQALGVEPARVEVNVYGQYGTGKSAAALDFESRTGARWFQRVMSEWATLSDDERRELARTIRQLEGEDESGPTAS